jgi:hypothetical protein
MGDPCHVGYYYIYFGQLTCQGRVLARAKAYFGNVSRHQIQKPAANMFT